MAHDTDREDRRQHAHRSVKALLMAYVAPWLGWFLLLPVAVVANLEWGGKGNTTTGVAFLLVALTGGMVRLTSMLTTTRHKAVRELAMGTSAAGGLWLVCALMFGPLAHPWIDAWQFGAAVPLGWNAYRALSHVKDAAVGGAAGKLLEVIGQAKVSKVRAEATRLGEVVHADLEVVRGEQTVKDLQSKAEHIEQLAHLRRGSVIISSDPDDAGRGKLLVIPTDTLKTPVLWTGPSRPGANIIEPIECGAYIDGLPMELTLPGSEADSRNLAHILFNGVTGAGKSQNVCQMMTSILCRTEVCVVASDPVKGTQTLGPFLDTGALELASLDLGTSKALLGAVKRSIAARGSFLGAKGLKQWEPGCGLTFLIVWLEEATWATQSGVLTDICAQARSVGIEILLSQQRSSYDTTDTTLRSNLTAGISGGLKSAMDAKFNLPDWLVDLVGDTLESWGASKPGYMIASHPSIPEGDQVKPWRSFKTTDAQMREALRQWAHVRSPMDATTRQAFGATYDQIRRVMSGEEAPPAVATRDTDDGFDSLTDEMDDTEGLDDMDDEDDTEDDEEISDSMGVKVDPNVPIPDDILADFAGLPFGPPPPGRKLTTEQARAVVQRHLRDMLAAGKTEVTPSDVAHMRPPTTRERDWIRLELFRLCNEPGPGEIALHRVDDGPYTILADATAEPALTGSAP